MKILFQKMFRNVYFKLFALLNFIFIVCKGHQTCSLQKDTKSHSIGNLSNNQLRFLATQYNSQILEHDFDHIYKIRHSGSKEHADVRNYIRTTLKDLGWTMSEDKFTEHTIEGPYTFTNLIAVRHPDAPRRLVLACHTDSKVMANFRAAIDSALPCALMLDIARSFQSSFNSLSNPEVSLELIFFDGEEAFREWTSTDSIYGARHLANLWYQTPHINTGCSKLQTIDLFVLLDLLGASNPHLPDYQMADSRYYEVMAKIERRAEQLNLLRNHRKKYFSNKRYSHGIEDDHIPFLRNGVPILHLIPIPFPPVWHTEQDTKENLDWDVIYNLDLIIKSFVAEYLNLYVPVEIVSNDG